MNLELLDPFGRQVPDRVDATIQLADSLHYSQHHQAAEEHDSDDDEWKAAYHVAYNRRGTYLAVGHASGAVAVHCTLNRTLASLYYPPDQTETAASVANNNNSNKNKSINGCSSLSWARRSRGLLAGSSGDSGVRLYDTTHPAGPEECSAGLLLISGATAAAGDDDYGENGENGTAPQQGVPHHHHPRSQQQATITASPSSDEVLPDHDFFETQHTAFADADRRYVFVKNARRIATVMLEKGGEIPAAVAGPNDAMDVTTDTDEPKKRYPCVYFEFPHAVAGSLQINPRLPNSGLAVLSNGALVLFWVPVTAYVEDSAIPEPSCFVAPLYDAVDVTCAAFDPHGTKVYAVHRHGTLMGFNVENVWRALMEASAQKKTHQLLPTCEPAFQVSVTGAGKGSSSSGGSAVWHLLVSRNGKFLILNSSDGAIRLYTTKECWEQTTEVAKPTWVFQDVVTKVKFASCDLSGDGEYVVGGADGADNKYELYIWNTSTGALMDKLTGASTKLYCVAWHPTRSFLAVACADGLVDIWGPRINWTAFAPDFQALPMNVEYIEREDEFDVDENGEHLAAGHDAQSTSGGNEDTIVDIMSIKPVPVFASDSEDEDDVFAFETRVKNLLAGRAEKTTKKSGAGADD